jgi:hypothetical protein
VCHSTFRGDLQTIHLPEVNLPAIVPPENIALAVTVIVADVLDVPIGREDGSVEATADLAKQTITVPASPGLAPKLATARSSRPSPFRSAMATEPGLLSPVNESGVCVTKPPPTWPSKIEILLEALATRQAQALGSP